MLNAINMNLTSVLVIVVASLCVLQALVHSGPLDRRMHPEYREVPAAHSRDYSEENETAYWLNKAKAFVLRKQQQPVNRKVAKNIIFFIGDGMSHITLAAARMLNGGEESSLSFEEFPNMGMAKTYCVDTQVPDSACTGTAFLSGVKANDKTVGVSARVHARNCTEALDPLTHTTSIAKWAMDAKKVAGLVTTTRITHATPASVYAHSAFRDWENNADVLRSQCDDTLVDDIAEQMVHGEVGQKFKVIFGGGRREFLDASFTDEEGMVGYRSDGKNLIEEWKAKVVPGGGERTYVWNKVSLIFQLYRYPEILIGNCS